MTDRMSKERREGIRPGRLFNFLEGSMECDHEFERNTQGFYEVYLCKHCGKNRTSVDLNESMRKLELHHVKQGERLRQAKDHLENNDLKRALGLVIGYLVHDEEEI